MLALLSAPLTLAAAPVSSPPPDRMTVQLVLPPKSAPPARLVDQLAGVAESSFVQNLGLLFVTALVTGLAVPRVKAGMDMRFFREQKQHEAQLARQASLITEQTKFLSSYIAALWRLHFNMIKVTYAKATGAPAAEFAALWTKYGPESWASLQEIRRLTSAAVHLVSEAHFRRMLDFYGRLLAKEAIVSNAVDGGSFQPSGWPSLHNTLLNQFARELDAEIIALATELRLTPTSTAAA